ncbi:DUF6884 domain-containing protein [Thermovibrio sp.]
MSKRVALITACGGKKEEKSLPAGKLYKSARIRHLYRRSKELSLPFFILSAKYGLISADETVEPYEAVMDRERCKELLPQIISRLKEFDAVVYFKGGARRDYLECIEKAAKEAKVELFVFGYGNMGGVKELTSVLAEAGFELLK